jgi:hypothetical protein
MTENADGLVPDPRGVLTVTGPLLASSGTTAVNAASDLTEKLVAGRPLKVTDVAPVKYWPVTRIVSPTPPALGEKVSTAGAPRNVATTEWSLSILRAQVFAVPAVAQSPPQLMNAPEAELLAVSVTSSPNTKDDVHFAGQEIAAGKLVTWPSPVVATTS